MINRCYADIERLNNPRFCWKFITEPVSIKFFDVCFLNGACIRGYYNIFLRKDYRFADVYIDTLSNTLHLIYKVKNISIKPTIDLNDNIHRAITNYKQNLKVIKEYQESNNKILKQYIKTRCNT